MCQTQGLTGGSSPESWFLPAGAARHSSFPRLRGPRQAGAQQGFQEDQGVREDVRCPRAGVPAASTGGEWTEPDSLAAGSPPVSRRAARCLFPPVQR